MYEDSKIELTIEYLSFDSDTKLDLNSRLELENFRKLLSKLFKKLIIKIIIVGDYYATKVIIL